MADTIAELQRLLEEERRGREAAERREKEERQAREEAERLRQQAEQQLRPNNIFQLLDRCHNSLSRAIRIETDAALTTQGDATNPINRLYPQQIVPWTDFPQLQEKIWEKLDSTAFTSRLLFPSDTQIDYVVNSVEDKPIYSEASLRNFERDTVDNFVELVIEALRDDTNLKEDFGIHGRVTFYDRATPAETSLENSFDQMDLRNPAAPRQTASTRQKRSRGNRKGTASRPTKAGHTRRRNRRADQFCVHTVAGEQQTPVYAVEFKAPHKVTIPELVEGLHRMNLARDVIDQEGDTFEFYATRLVAAVVTQIFSYMIDSGVRYGYICTGEAFVFLRIPEDPTVVQYYLCVPNQDVATDEEGALHRTAIAQVLAFTLQALVAEGPSQEWHDVAHNQLLTWEVEYLDVLRQIPETVRKDPPASNYRPSHWKREPKIHNTRSRTRCQPVTGTPKASSAEGSSSDEASQSPSTTAAARNQSSRRRGDRRRVAGGREKTRAGEHQTSTSRNQRHSTLPYCSIACIHGLANRGLLDKSCPNVALHGDARHSIEAPEFICQLRDQLARDRVHGFKQLDICGRTGYLLKATLLSHGYTVIIKATTAEKEHRLTEEVDNYHHLRSLQGQYIPVCIGTFTPPVQYWYHGEPMAQMMVLSWSGRRLQQIINAENSDFFYNARKNALATLRSYGLDHGDSEWRNMLWDDRENRLIVIDLEDVTWSKRPRALESTSGNARDRRCLTRPKYTSKRALVYHRKNRTATRLANSPVR